MTPDQVLVEQARVFVFDWSGKEKNPGHMLLRVCSQVESAGSWWKQSRSNGTIITPLVCSGRLVDRLFQRDCCTNRCFARFGT
jgi:hypothetical protein